MKNTSGFRGYFDQAAMQNAQEGIWLGDTWEVEMNEVSRGACSIDAWKWLHLLGSTVVVSFTRLGHGGARCLLKLPLKGNVATGPFQALSLRNGVRQILSSKVACG